MSILEDVKTKFKKSLTPEYKVTVNEISPIPDNKLMRCKKSGNVYLILFKRGGFNAHYLGNGDLGFGSSVEFYSIDEFEEFEGSITISHLKPC